ncbi:MAG TPA: hypothetical protein PK530_09060 [Anaerolineales bacterium]|nr:hypothetical protein [Anaerolineales bacterium]
MKKKISLPLALLIFLSLEKFVQHMAGTYAFAVNLRAIRGSVVVDYRFLMVMGFFVGLLFLVNVRGLYQEVFSSRLALFFLALFDFVGEFIAQGKLAIELTVSFLVATVIMVIIGISWRHL